MKATFLVARYVPRDIARFSHAAAATVLLAAALDWDVIEKPSKATILRGPENVVIEVPDHQNLKFNVYRSWVRKISTHTAEFVLPMDVATKIADVCKLPPDHRRVLIDLAEQSVIPDDTPDEVPEEPPPTIVSREPYNAHLKGSMTYESAASYERTWSDGHLDYECMVCGEAFAVPKALGGHRQMHIRRGEAEPNWRDQLRESVRGKDPDWVVTPRTGSESNGTQPDEDEPEPQPVVEIEPELETGSAAEMLGVALRIVDRKVHAVLAENEQLKKQVAKLRSDIAAMFSLMQEMAKEDEA